MKSFKDLNTWQEGHILVLLIYKFTRLFPTDERFGLTSQMRRSAVSITSNISEGFGRFSKKEKVQFYCYANASINELHNQLMIAKDVDFLEQAKFAGVEQQLIRVQKMLWGLIKIITSRVS